MFTRIAHVCINTNDLSKSIDFYSKLGSTVKFRFTRNGRDFGAYLEFAPGSFIEIFEEKNPGPVFNNGITHFCLETRSIDALVEKLSGLRIPFTPIKTGCDLTRQIWLADPDGNRFEVHEYTENSMQLKGGDSVEADW